MQGLWISGQHTSRLMNNAHGNALGPEQHQDPNLTLRKITNTSAGTLSSDISGNILHHLISSLYKKPTPSITTQQQHSTCYFDLNNLFESHHRHRITRFRLIISTYINRSQATAISTNVLSSPKSSHNQTFASFFLLTLYAPASSTTQRRLFYTALLDSPIFHID
ncbi:hypothetical protein O0I10_009117 [Lichtheimia ornata]|uniref:Uncharacterized protein n=1 Tax=Lichtheimia ornata TaxID=688661 RepID=A0AAD7XSG1_9FUNG|nr:uncharacterized protein O0I10_009117 [Lichtheimia ornata]KAJ8655249.1 hypothetical protein O0I10_009117 [Lichtheimia ornata]